jgi:hypothetical protein
MMNRILVKRSHIGAYGQEYEVFYLRDGMVVHKSVMFGNDLRYANLAYTTDFKNIKPERISARKLRKVI